MEMQGIIIFIISLFGLLYASKYLVESSVRVAKRLGISEFFIGLTIISISTSLPELVAGVAAALANETGLIIGDVIGSNIANIGLVLGVGTLLVAIKTTANQFKRDGIFLLFITVLFAFLSLDGVISFVEGIIFLLLFAFYMFVVYSSKDDANFQFTTYLNSLYHLKNILTFKNSEGYLNKLLKRDGQSYEKLEKSRIIEEGVSFKIFKEVVIIIIAGIVLSLSARFLISSSVSLASALNVSKEIIGVSFIAIGTSLPELGVTIVSAKKGLYKILLGNVVGSNISNLLLIVGVSSLITPLIISREALVFMIPGMLLMTLFLVYFIKSDWLKRSVQGILLLVLYLLFLILLIFLI